MAILILTNGSTLEVTPNNGKDFTLKELQDFVGGYIEQVSLPKEVIFCNEEGKLNELPVNIKATILIRSAFEQLGRTFNDVLVGDIIVCSPSEVR